MKIISKTKACDILITIDERTTIYDFVNVVKVTDVSYKEVKAMIRVSPNYYWYVVIVESRNIIIAMRTNRNQIDVLDLNTLEIVHKIKWLFDKSCTREKSVLSKDKKYIYSLSYTDKDQSTSFITRLNLDTYEEELIARLPGRYLFDIKCWGKEDYLLAGIHFYEEDNEFGAVGEYEIFSLNNIDEKHIFTSWAKSPYAHLNLIGITEEQEVLYWYDDFEGEWIYNLNTGERLITLPHNSQVAFSENGKYFAYATCDKEKTYLNVYSYGKRKVVDKLEFQNSGRSLVGATLEFRGNDKYLMFQFDNATYLLEMEVK